MCACILLLRDTRCVSQTKCTPRGPIAKRTTDTLHHTPPLAHLNPTHNTTNANYIYSWVEVYDAGAWSFLGAAEPAPPNVTWFFPHPAKAAVPGSRLHAIYAATFRRPAPGGLTFPLAWALDDDSVPALDVTQHYLDTPDA